MTVKKQRKVLRGWIKWVPVVAIPFAILFFHTWLNIEIIRADYVLRELDAEAREWADRLNHTGVAETIHQDPEMLAEQAEQLAFVQPSPGQRESIPWRQLDIPEDTNFAVAQLDSPSQPDPAVTESMSAQSAYVDTPSAAPTTEVVATQPPLDYPAPSAVEIAPATVAPTPAEPITPNPPTESIPLDGPATVTTPVVLELPEDAYIEDMTVLEAEMESFESL